MMKLNWSIENKTRVTFVLVMLLVILIGFFAYRNTLSFLSGNQAILQTLQVIDEFQVMNTNISEVENALLKNLVANDTTYLQGYADAKGQIAEHLANLKNLLGSDAEARGQLASLDGLITQWTAQMDGVVAVQEREGIDAARQALLGEQSNGLTDQIRAILDTMTKVQQDQLVVSRSVQTTQRSQYTLTTFAVLTLLMVALLAYGYRIVQRDLTRRQRLEHQLSVERTLLRTVIDVLPDTIYVKDTQLRFVLTNRSMAALLGAKTSEEVIGKSDADYFPAALVPQYAADEKAILASGQPLLNREEPSASATGEEKIMLTTKVPVLNAAGDITQIVGISHDITLRKQEEEKIDLLNKSLQRQTAQLETANSELEAFSYSVSHDLRAPLRAIDGFSRILSEDYASNLPAEGERYLQKVRSNAQRMGTLIDDLLRFSRLSRQPISKQSIQPTALVRQIFSEDLSSETENRQIEFNLSELPACSADPLLLRQVYTNLLSNAIKFTCKRDVAQIDVGSLQENGTTAYFVKDNGAGFDQQYENKLFGVFQRLHRVDDFPGTGVGLAIVERIIHRHGGRVWAEGALDKGAAFYFTLALEDEHDE